MILYNWQVDVVLRIHQELVKNFANKLQNQLALVNLNLVVYLRHHILNLIVKQKQEGALHIINRKLELLQKNVKFLQRVLRMKFVPG
uniref:Uncharacterized protein n=1 Tax=viral metagenome TaxID=1070528 RepID=A0A6C0H386_9ZZZZ